MQSVRTEGWLTVSLMLNDTFVPQRTISFVSTGIVRNVGCSFSAQHCQDNNIYVCCFWKKNIPMIFGVLYSLAGGCWGGGWVGSVERALLLVVWSTSSSPNQFPFAPCTIHANNRNSSNFSFISGFFVYSTRHLVQRPSTSFYFVSFCLFDSRLEFEVRSFRVNTISRMLFSHCTLHRLCFVICRSIWICVRMMMDNGWLTDISVELFVEWYEVFLCT